MPRTSIINEEQQQQQQGKLHRYARIESVSRLKVVWALAYCDLITIATGLLCHFPCSASLLPRILHQMLASHLNWLLARLEVCGCLGNLI